MTKLITSQALRGESPLSIISSNPVCRSARGLTAPADWFSPCGADAENRQALRKGHEARDNPRCRDSLRGKKKQWTVTKFWEVPERGRVQDEERASTWAAMRTALEASWVQLGLPHCVRKCSLVDVSEPAADAHLRIVSFQCCRQVRGCKRRRVAQAAMAHQVSQWLSMEAAFQGPNVCRQGTGYESHNRVAGKNNHGEH